MCGESLCMSRDEDVVSINTSLTETEWTRANVASLVSGNKRSEFYARAIVSATEDILKDKQCMKPVCSSAYSGPASFDEAISMLEEVIFTWKRKENYGGT